MWAVIVLCVVVVVVQGLLRRTVVIETISVPRRLEHNGFTGEVAAKRLRDAVVSRIKTLKTHMKAPDVRLLGDEPTIVVPAIGVSLDSIVAMMRTFFYSSYRRNISGDLTLSANKLWLRLRLNGQLFYVSPGSDNSDAPDQLFDAAAQRIVERSFPYLYASDLYYKDPEKALEAAKDGIAELSPSDEEVPWLYNLEGLVYLHKNWLENATMVVNEALKLNSHLPIVHLTMAAIFDQLNNRRQAIAECRRAISLDPNYPEAHMNMGEFLKGRGRSDLAKAEFKLAIDESREVVDADPKNVPAHNDLGIALMQNGQIQDAIAEFRKSLSIDENNVPALDELGVALARNGKKRLAIDEFQKALSIDAKDRTADEQLKILGSDISVQKK
jgi:Flp pilus assembly protein TadD